MIQLARSRLVQVVHNTDKGIVQFPVDNNKNILEVYIFDIVFALNFVPALGSRAKDLNPAPGPALLPRAGFSSGRQHNVEMPRWRRM